MFSNQVVRHTSLAMDRIVREKERRHITGRSPAQWWRDERDGKAPQRIRLGENAVGWRLSDLLAWIESRQVCTSGNTKPVAPGSKRGRKPGKTMGGANHASL